MDKTAAMIIGAVCYIVFAPFVGGLLSGFDRKLSARMQGRQGPPLLQPFYDLSKLLQKETTVINDIQRLLAWCFLIFIVFTGALFYSGADLLLCFFSLTTAAIFLVISAFSASSPFSTVGAQRELAQMLSYEPMVLLTAVGFYLASGSFASADIAAGDVSAIRYLPGVFAGFLLILPIKMRKSPFDVSTSHHAHQEVVKGVTTELGGGNLALVEIAEWYETVFLLGIVGLFIVNSRLWSIAVAIAVCLLAYFIEILIDNTSARVKWQEMLRFAWMTALICGVANIVIVWYLK